MCVCVGVEGDGSAVGSTEPLTPSESDLRCMRHNVGQKGLSTKGRKTMQQKYISHYFG